MRTGLITRDLTKAEFPWLKKDIKASTLVFEFTDCTYGCINEESGVAVSLDRDMREYEFQGETRFAPPEFFQVPKSAVIWDK